MLARPLQVGEALLEPPPLAIDVRQPPLHPKRSAALRLLAAGNGSLFAGVCRLHCRDALMSYWPAACDMHICGECTFTANAVAYNLVLLRCHRLPSPLKTVTRHTICQARWCVHDASSLPVQHRQHRQQPGMHPAPSFSGRAPPDPSACRTPVVTPGSALLLSRTLFGGMQLCMQSSMLSIVGMLVASMYMG